MERFPITAKGHEMLLDEIKHLKSVERPKVIQEIATARELGDLSENAEYHAAREKQSFIEGKILDLEDKLARSEIIDISKLSGDTIKFGATVYLYDEDADKDQVYVIVSDYEADLTKGYISLFSPLARAAIGKKIGDNFDVVTPRSTKTYEITNIQYISY